MNIITDIGEGADYPGGRICRYGVWVVVKGVADHVIDMSDDLDELKEKYPGVKVYELKNMTLGGKEESDGK